MNPKRFLVVFAGEMKENLTRPIFWVWLLVLGFLSWGLSTGHVRIASGDSAVGGQKAWFTSEFAISQFFAMTVLILDAFFIAVLSGTALVRDFEIKVGEVLHSTPLRTDEYVFGKFAAAITTGAVVLLANALLLAVFNHVLPNAEAEDIRGPFQLLNYVKPALLFGLPTLFFVSGVSFAIGAISRRPILVFLFPVALLMVDAFFLWEWSPYWLNHQMNRILQVIEPGAFRWINETWLKVDRGVEHYNLQPVGLDGVFLLNRLIGLLVGAAAVVWAQAHLAANIRGRSTPQAMRAAERAAAKQARRAGGSSEEAAATSGAMAGTTAGITAATSAGIASLAGRPLSALAMRSTPPRLMSGIASVLRFEWQELWSSPGLYLFAPIILLQILGGNLVAVGAFDTPLLITAGTVAARSMNTITFLVSLLLLFYTVESLRREDGAQLSGIYFSTPVPTASILFGKALANSMVGFVVVLASFLGCVIALLVQGKVPLEIGPFVLLWGVLLLPTFLLWSSFVGALYALTRNRYTVYAVGFGVLMLTFALQMTGKINWASNWNLWDTAFWSDIAPLPLDRQAYLWNRFGALALTVLFTAVTVRAFPRRDSDATRVLQNLRPGPFWRGALRLAPYLVVPIVCVIALVALVRGGFQGKGAEKTEREHWVQNLATWKDAPIPSMSFADIDLTLEPKHHAFRCRGEFHLVNRTEKPLARFAVTGGLHWDSCEWSLNGSPYTPEDRTSLFVIKPDPPLAPGDSLVLGFSNAGRWPRGNTRNGRGMSEFILPEAAVLTYIGGATFAPVVGYNEAIGVTDKNRYEPRVYPDDHWKEVLPPAFGGDTPYRTRIKVTGPAELTYNSVGVLTADETSGGLRTMTWESDFPVRFWNVVAGKWAVKRGEGTAIYYDPKHPYNIEEMSRALDAARKYYSEWFRPFPWQELKLSEFPALASYAQGFPTNITFSESIGFLTKSDDRGNVAFLVTAHEAAHQWWGNLLTPGRGPGGDILSEGMSHFSTALLQQQVLGEQARIQFLLGIEDRYGDSRQADSERPLIKIDGSKPGDTTVTYDKGGWVMWMLYDLMGREACLAGLQEFMRRFGNGPDYPLLEDLVLTLREYAPDREAFDLFVKQWYFEVNVPEYRLRDPKTTESEGTWTTTCVVRNIGTARMPIEVAATLGERFRKDKEAAAPADSSASGGDQGSYQEIRASLVLGPAEEQTVTLASRFKPEAILVDPDARVLMLNRKVAKAAL
ncbi:MAG: hypothetical protein IPK72_20785 [Candidatus Eisenbacteria bacterium]|nr:hypothetical protein [Candidatus Eisenbacteria bacterium]